jgi:hypothetical protein
MRDTYEARVTVGPYGTVIVPGSEVSKRSCEKKASALLGVGCGEALSAGLADTTAIVLAKRALIVKYILVVCILRFLTVRYGICKKILIFEYFYWCLIASIKVSCGNVMGTYFHSRTTVLYTF